MTTVTLAGTQREKRLVRILPFHFSSNPNWGSKCFLSVSCLSFSLSLCALEKTLSAYYVCILISFWVTTVTKVPALIPSYTDFVLSRLQFKYVAWDEGECVYFMKDENGLCTVRCAFLSFSLSFFLRHLFCRGRPSIIAQHSLSPILI